MHDTSLFLLLTGILWSAFCLFYMLCHAAYRIYDKAKALHMDHPEITCAQKTGYPSWIRSTAQIDKDEYIDDHKADLFRWLRSEHPEILDEFVEELLLG